MRVIIAGGSVGGLFIAALLMRAGHKVQIFERSLHGLAGRGAGLVAQEEVFDILTRVGRNDIAHTGVTAASRIVLGRSGAIESRLLHPQTQISWDRLYLGFQAMMTPSAYNLGRAVVAAGSSDTQAWVDFSDGSREFADLVIGADGIGSAVRTAMADNRQILARYAGYVAWRFLIPEDRLSGLSAEVLSDNFAFYHGPRTQVLGYLVAGPAGEIHPGSRRYNCVWYRQHADLDGLLTDRSGKHKAYSLAPGAVPEALRSALLDDARMALPRAFVEVMEAEPTPFVQAIFDLESAVMVSGRLALMGDAAFVARPHTAMGVAKAAGDAMTLADLLREFELAQALEAYANVRAPIGRNIVRYGQRLGAELTV